MSTPLLALGPHTFAVTPLNFHELSRDLELRWAAMRRLGAAPFYQAIGVGETAMVITGLLFPDAIGGWNEFRALEATARQMKPVMMVAGSGIVHGLVVITHISEAHRSIGAAGMPRMVEFAIDVNLQG